MHRIFNRMTPRQVERLVAYTVILGFLSFYDSRVHAHIPRVKRRDDLLHFCSAYGA